jgi:hypothetical protein
VGARRPRERRGAQRPRVHLCGSRVERVVGMQDVVVEVAGTEEGVGGAPS